MATSRPTARTRAPLIGIAADHGGYELKQYLERMLRKAGHNVEDFGDRRRRPKDDYPDFIIPLARAVAAGQVTRGIGICGSGVGASVAANKVPGVRACLIHEGFSAHQGVEDDNLNLICLGGLVVGHRTALELVQIFLAARFSGAKRHLRRLAKVAALERGRSLVALLVLAGATAVAAAAPASTPPDSAEIHYGLGEAALRRGDPKEAVRELEAAVALEPGSARDHAALGDAYGRSAQKAGLLSRFGLARKCLAEYERAVALDPGNVDIHEHLFKFFTQAPAIVGGGRDKAAAEAAIIAKLDPGRGQQAYDVLKNMN